MTQKSRPAGRTYNEVHRPRKYASGHRRVSIYISWSYPAEANRSVIELDNRFSTRFSPKVGAFGPSDGCADEVRSGNVIHETGVAVRLD